RLTRGLCVFEKSMDVLIEVLAPEKWQKIVVIRGSSDRARQPGDSRKLVCGCEEFRSRSCDRIKDVFGLTGRLRSAIDVLVEDDMRIPLLVPLQTECGT